MRNFRRGIFLVGLAALTTAGLVAMGVEPSGPIEFGEAKAADSPEPTFKIIPPEPCPVVDTPEWRALEAELGAGADDPTGTFSPASTVTLPKEEWLVIHDLITEALELALTYLDPLPAPNFTCGELVRSRSEWLRIEADAIEQRDADIERIRKALEAWKALQSPAEEQEAEEVSVAVTCGTVIHITGQKCDWPGCSYDPRVVFELPPTFDVKIGGTVLRVSVVEGEEAE